MQRSIFLILTALIFTVGILADALNNIDEVCKPNLPNGGKAIICHQTGLSNFNRDPPVYNAAFRNDAKSICCSSGSQCLLSRNYNQVACYNPSTKIARTATASGNCNLVKSDRAYTGQQCTFGDNDILDKDDNSLSGTEKFTSVSNGVGQVGVDVASSGSVAGAISTMNSLRNVLVGWAGFNLLAVVM
ncbi:hypothetical protein BGZ60DRAFT_430154 [Tricladium varicosporioides]|nr:hypothetical protein BGZ60DRAFT_430154 [Hymenoscyphus varicosporioides]